MRMVSIIELVRVYAMSADIAPSYSMNDLIDRRSGIKPRGGRIQL